MKSKKIIITGGATRIGAAIAEKLSGEDVEMVIHFNKSKILAKNLKKKLSNNGTKVFLAQGDLSKEANLNRIIKFEILSCVFSNFWASIIPAAKSAHGAAEPDMNSKDLLKAIGSFISIKIINNPTSRAISGRFVNCFKTMFFELMFFNVIKSKIIKFKTRNTTSNPIMLIIGAINASSYSFKAIG